MMMGEEEQYDEGEGIPAEEEQEEEDYDPIQKQIEAMHALCIKGNGVYGDSTFPPNDSSLFHNPLEPPDYAEKCANIQWMRPQEMSTSKDGDDKPKVCLIEDGSEPGDVKQGDLGDCWFLGALCCLATRKDLLQNLFVYDGMEHGFVVFQFFKNGEWKKVFIDTRIPVNSENK